MIGCAGGEVVRDEDIDFELMEENYLNGNLLEGKLLEVEYANLLVNMCGGEVVGGKCFDNTFI